MRHRDAITETLPQPADDLGGEGDLRQEVQHLLAPVQRFLDQGDVQFGLPGRGDTAQQDHRPFLEGRPHLVQCGALGLGKHGFGTPLIGRRWGAGLPFLHQEQALLHQGLQHRIGSAGSPKER